MDATRVLLLDEIHAVLADLKRRCKRSRMSRANRIIFVLSAGCGLRACEICGLNIGDVVVSGQRPCIRVRKETTKGKNGKRKSRIVPLWWDREILRLLSEWMAYRRDSGAENNDPIIGTGPFGNNRIVRTAVAHRWKTAIKGLGPERTSQLSIHCGRHSFISHALAVGRSLAEVRDAAGHANISTTSVYAHALGNPGVGDLYFRPSTQGG